MNQIKEIIESNENVEHRLQSKSIYIARSRVGGVDQLGYITNKFPNILNWDVILLETLEEFNIEILQWIINKRGTLTKLPVCLVRAVDYLFKKNYNKRYRCLSYINIIMGTHYKSFPNSLLLNDVKKYLRYNSKALLPHKVNVDIDDINKQNRMALVLGLELGNYSIKLRVALPRLAEPPGGLELRAPEACLARFFSIYYSEWNELFPLMKIDSPQLKKHKEKKIRQAREIIKILSNFFDNDLINTIFSFCFTRVPSSYKIRGPG